MREEWVVLVDELDRELGIARKDEVHGASTPLHRAFSVFLFDAAGRALVQQRAAGKRTWPGIWSNGCCGHPGPGEATLEAARRRSREELGLELDDPWVALPDYRYRAQHDGVVEHEICPVLVARVAGDPAPDPAEVGEWRWLGWQELLDELARRPLAWSPWCREEAVRLDAEPAFRAWLDREPAGR